MGKLKYKPGDAVIAAGYIGLIDQYLGHSWYGIFRMYNYYKGVGVSKHSFRVNQIRSISIEQYERNLEKIMNPETPLNTLIRRATPDNVEHTVKLMRSYIRGNRRIIRNALDYSKNKKCPVPTFEELSKYNIGINTVNLNDLRAAA